MSFSNIQNRSRSWTRTIISSLPWISLRILFCVVVLGRISNGMTKVFRGDEMQNTAASSSTQTLPEDFIVEDSDTFIKDNGERSKFHSIDVDNDEGKVEEKDNDEKDDTMLYKFQVEYSEEWDGKYDEIVEKAVFNRKDYEGIDGLSKEDWIWLEFFDGLSQGFLHIDKITALYDCPSYDEEGVVLKKNDRSCAVSADRQCTSQSEPAYSRIPTEEETWKLFGEAYYSVMGTESPPLPRYPQQAKDSQKHIFEATRGMKISYQVKYDETNPMIGRTIYSTTFIPNGTEVWTGSHTASFTQDPSDPTPYFQISSYRRFLDYLYEHFLSLQEKDNDAHNWACDAMMWTFSSSQVGSKTKDNEDEIPALCVTFDHGSLFNDAAHDDTMGSLVDGEYNDNISAFYLTGVIRDTPGVGKSSTIAEGSTISATNEVKFPSARCHFEPMIASRDIQPGEELRYQYKTYVIEIEEYFEYVDDDEAS